MATAVQKLPDNVYFRRTRSFRFSPCPVPMRAGHLFVIANEDGTESLGFEELTVLGVASSVVELYGRRRRSEFDSGDPRGAPTPASLCREGYWFSGEEAGFDWVLFDPSAWSEPTTLRDLKEVAWGRDTEFVIAPADKFDVAVAEAKRQTKLTPGDPA